MEVWADRRSAMDSFFMRVGHDEDASKLKQALFRVCGALERIDLR